MTAAELDALVARLQQRAQDTRHLRSDVSDVLDEAAAALVSLRDQLAEAAQYRHGHLPTCAGYDLVAMTCGCGYLDGTAYREIIARAEKAEAERDEYKRNLQAELDGHMEWRKIIGARPEETMFQVADRIAKERAELAAAQRRIAEWCRAHSLMRERAERAESAQRSPPRELWAIASKYIDCYVRQVNVIGGLQEADADRAYLSQLDDAAPQTDATQRRIEELEQLIALRHATTGSLISDHVAATIERCAKVCDAIALDPNDEYNEFAGTTCAAAIRALAKD